MKGLDLVGALILDPARGTPNKTEVAQAKATAAMEYAACLIHQHVAETMCGGGEKPSAEHCVVFHAFRGERVCAPASYKKKLGNMEAVCRVITRAWEETSPPPAFNPALATYRG